MAVKIARPFDDVADVPIMENPLDVVSAEEAGDVVSEQELQRAISCEQAVLRLKRQTVLNFVEMGRYLKEIRDKSYYKLLGYTDFETWCESPEIDFSRSTVYRYIALVEKLVDTGIYKLEELEDKSLYKLVAIAPYVTSENRLEHLLGLSTNDFKVELAKFVEEQKGLVRLPGMGTKSSKAIPPATKSTVSGGSHSPKTQAIDQNMVEDADFEEVKSESVDEEETVPPFDINEFGLKGLFRLVPVKLKPSEEYIDFPDVKIKGTIFVKQTADGKEFLLEL